MGTEVVVENLTKSFGRQTIWQDVTLTLPPGEISVMLGPSGTGKSVFLKSLVGLLKPERGKILIHGVDVCTCSEHKLYATRKLFGVLFQDGALFGSMNVYDNIAFPLREHTKKSESEIKGIVCEKMEMVGLVGAEKKLPGEISGGMRKRAGLARALVLDPEIILFDEPDSGLDPVRVAYLNQLIVDLNAQTDATFLIVTHDIGTARSVPDNLGMLFRRNLVMFGPREVLLTSEEPVVKQFLNGRRQGPIGMSEEKDSAQMAAEAAEMEARGGEYTVGPKGGSGWEGGKGIAPQIEPSPGLPVRQAVHRRRQRVMAMLHTLPAKAQQAIIDTLTADERAEYDVGRRSQPALPDQVPLSGGGAQAGAVQAGGVQVGGVQAGGVQVAERAPVRPSPTPRSAPRPPQPSHEHEAASRPSPHPRPYAPYPDQSQQSGGRAAQLPESQWPTGTRPTPDERPADGGDR